MRDSLDARYRKALDGLVAGLREDRSVLAAILCGSLSHDRVWEQSDIDLVLVTVDDRKVREGGVALWADGVNVHALLLPRDRFRQITEGALRNSFMHALLAKGRLLYTHDETIAQRFDRLDEIGERDTQVQLLAAGTMALSCAAKARKWLVTRNDLEYTALWILYAATALARIEVLSRRLVADREVIVQALALNPAFFRAVYTDLLNQSKTVERVADALTATDAYLADRAVDLFGPVFEHLRDVGEARTCTELEDHFRRNLGFDGVTTACEYLAERGLIGKAAIAARLTPRSNRDVQELAFFALGDMP